MKYILLICISVLFVSCASRQINGKSQTFSDYVIFNKYSEYKGESMNDWKTQPEDNFPIRRLIKWNKSKQGE